jgi:hypothetical protein
LINCCVSGQFGRRRPPPPASFFADPGYRRERLDVVDVFVMLTQMMFA